MLRKRIASDTFTDESVIDRIQELALKRRRLIRMSVRLTNSIKGAIRVCKGTKNEDGYLEGTEESEEAGDKLIKDHMALCMKGKAEATEMPACIDHVTWFQIDHHFFVLYTFKVKIKAIDKEIETLAKQLPYKGFVERRIPGMGLLRYGLLIGTTGDLVNYSTPAKVWKRLGLAPITKGEITQAGSTWRNPKTRHGDVKLTDEEWITAGYSPQRRSLVWNIGAGMLKAGLRKNSDGVSEDRNRYTRLYLKRKAFEKRHRPDLSDKAHHLRAQRFMEKRAIKDIWQRWRGAVSEEEKAAIAKKFKRAAAKVSRKKPAKVKPAKVKPAKRRAA